MFNISSGKIFALYFLLDIKYQFTCDDLELLLNIAKLKSIKSKIEDCGSLFDMTSQLCLLIVIFIVVKRLWFTCLPKSIVDQFCSCQRFVKFLVELGISYLNDERFPILFKFCWFTYLFINKIWGTSKILAMLYEINLPNLAYR